MAGPQSRTQMKVISAVVSQAPEQTAVGGTASGWSGEVSFGTSRAQPQRRGFEPGFVLFEAPVMEVLRGRAAARGIGYDALVRLIVREHIDKY